MADFWSRHGAMAANEQGRAIRRTMEVCHALLVGLGEYKVLVEDGGYQGSRRFQVRPLEDRWEKRGSESFASRLVDGWIVNLLLCGGLS